MSTQFFHTLISTFDNAVYHNTARSNESNPLVLQIKMNTFTLYTEIILQIWNHCLVRLKEDADKGKDHMERVCRHFDTPAARADHLNEGLTQLFKTLKNSDQIFLVPAKRGVLENAGAIRVIYQKVVLNWGEYEKNPAHFIAKDLYQVIMAHCIVPALPLYQGVSILNREVLDREDLAYLKLCPQEVTKERDCAFDCAGWALLAMRVGAFVADIKSFYLNHDMSLCFLFDFSAMKSRGLQPVKDPRPGDLVVYRTGVNPLLDSASAEAKQYYKQFDPDQITHFGILAPDGYVHSKLTAGNGVKIFRHKIWQVYETYGREVFFVRYLPIK